MLWDSDWVISLHAIEAYQIHHEDATRSDIESAIDRGHEASAELAASLCGRVTVDTGSRYFVSPDCQGMFVVSLDSRRVITYLRFQRQQQALCLKWFAPELLTEEGLAAAEEGNMTLSERLASVKQLIETKKAALLRLQEELTTLNATRKELGIRVHEENLRLAAARAAEE